ncbi:SDR family NAD(P)-dependent oxidoreductase [Alteromonas sp. BL110]|uniref:SDR family NAD(P)-dependent oxidoreductase n=1 Tax=Alteromonas sp. BL110 TaxID=1714845 RepID=UPI000E521AA2|nr:SDR family NAD(P)-dependent oxidoreductase [Alteromonas sp. BL110]AXT39013.1 SDR family NAD(P)-dependent oxidoreductase [Alteromonas sp. BL110]RKM84346.1 SDR family NAD(P)-dependent oxidoreductase [Alteromonas sp. BL110]
MMYLVTGAAGFIGYHVCKRLLEEGEIVVGVDNLNDYYSVELKLARLSNLRNFAQFAFFKIDIADRQAVERLFQEHKFEKVIHLAAQAGVRYSIDNPYAYADSNLMGMLTILEGCRHHKIKHLIYASSSSVYGMSDKVPFSEDDRVDNPVSFYAATKKANEAMVASYSNLYGLKCTGLRFFTVYGPWGRPDMAPMLFSNSLVNNNPIKIFNNGKMQRDFTYIDDIVKAVFRISKVTSESNRHQVYNIGNGKPVDLLMFIKTLETKFNIKGKYKYLDMQNGDVTRTYADISKLESFIEWTPTTSVDEGVSKFVDWYTSYYGSTNK